MNHKCEDCGRAIGLMADASGRPIPYICPRSKRKVTELQNPVPRSTRPLTREQREEIARLK